MTEPQEESKWIRIKQHFSDNKRTYFEIGGALVTVGFTCVVMRRCSSDQINRGISVVADRGISVAGKTVSMNNVSYINQNRKGSPSWVIRCLDTGLVYTSQRKAALAMDLPESELSKHLNGAMDQVRGYRFERICLAA